MVDLSGIDATSLVEELIRRIEFPEPLSDDELVNAVYNRNLVSYFQKPISSFSTEELITEIDLRGFDVTERSFSVVEQVVQKHRCGQEWQSDALEVLYNLANKVI